MVYPREIPERLYKYRSFDTRTFSMMLADKIYLSDPHAFNDPLDAKPHLVVDVESDELEAIFKKLFKQRFTRDMARGYLQARQAHELKLDQVEAAAAAEWEVEAVFLNLASETQTLSAVLAQRVEQLLLQRYDKGILCLAEQADCPLMWSHYADQHRGVCLGYSVQSKPRLNLQKVRYFGDRTISASLVGKMLHGDKDAARAVDTASLLTKAPKWDYEKEWRYIAPIGEHDSPLELEEVIFGLRFPSNLVPAVIKSFVGRPREVNFFRIEETRGAFDLRKVPLDPSSLPPKDEPRRYRSQEFRADIRVLPVVGK